MTDQALPISSPDRHSVNTPPRHAPQLNKGNGSFELVMSPLLLALVGLWLDDSVTHTTPWMTVIFALLGLTGSVVKIYYGYQAKMAELTAAAPWSVTSSATSSAEPTS